MRLLRIDEVLDVVPPLYERVARRWVGTIGRPEWMWKRYLKAATEPASTPFGKGEFVAVHTDADGVDDGYVHYETELSEEFADHRSPVRARSTTCGAQRRTSSSRSGSTCSTSTSEVWQADGATRQRSHPARAPRRRAYETRQIVDEQWLRLLDVDAALTARTYGPCSGDASRSP